MRGGIKIEDFLDRGKEHNIIDLRSPSEYMNGHIPQSLNIPLFNDEERRSVGILYRQKGRSVAIKKGFEIIAPKYSQFIGKLNDHAIDGILLLYCWRGGMRSMATGWFVEQSGINSIILENGYKSFRNKVREFFSKELKLYVLGGMTGCGKTQTLSMLKNKGHQVIDLEFIARHKGSAFGALGEEMQPTNEQFENNLLTQFLKLDTGKPIWIENESQAIGKVFIPPELFNQMKRSMLFILNIPENKRVERLVNEYSKYPEKELLFCMEKIRKKVGGQNYNQSINLLKSGHFEDFARIALKYYDKTYRYGLTSHDSGNILNLSTDGTVLNNVSCIEEAISSIKLK